MNHCFLCLAVVFLLISYNKFTTNKNKKTNPSNEYLSFDSSEDQATGGIKMIPFETNATPTLSIGAQYDQEYFFPGLISFIKDVNNGAFD